MAKRSIITVKDVNIRTLTVNGIDYICITDIARQKNEIDPNGVIGNWMRNRNTVEFLGIWETLHNPAFNPLEFEGFRKEAGLNAFTLSPTRWIESTNAIGIVTQAGRYGGTFAQTDIAFEFASWISVGFLEICKHFSNGLVTEKGNILRPGPIPRFSDLEVIALSMAAESEEIDSENWLFESKLKECRNKLPNLISRRQFNDRRKSVSNLQEEIRSRMAKEMDGGEDFFCIDSKPIEVCRISRGKRCKMGTNGDYAKAPDFGYCASQGTYFFGYKLHALCGLIGVIHSYELSKASVHDINYLKDIRQVYHDCNIFGDKGYLSAEVQLDLFETANIKLECPYRLNQKDWKPTFIPFARARKRIETLFSQLNDQFMVIRNYAKDTRGLFARIIGKISALTVLQYINYSNHKPIGRIKYALI